MCLFLFLKPFLLTIEPVPHSVEVGGVDDCDLQNVSAPGAENKVFSIRYQSFSNL